MRNVEVRTQAELDKAIKNQKPGDVIVCLGGTILSPLIVSGSSRVVAWGSSRVEARGSSRVEARESSRVEAWESSSVEAWGSSSVEAWGSSRVVARESSSVEAWGSSSVEAWGSSRVVARESSRVEARGSSRVEARESSRVEAWGSSSVEARESSSVEAWGSSRVVARESSRVVARESSRVVAGTFVSVHRHGKAATVRGGVLIDVPDPGSLSPEEWCDYYGVKVSRGIATLYKAVDDDYSTSYARVRGIFYAPGSKPKCDDFNKRQKCGGGIHASPSPAMAEFYNASATRYVAVPIKVSEIVVIDDKVKVPRIAGTVYEVDRHGDKLDTKASA